MYVVDCSKFTLSLTPVFNANLHAQHGCMAGSPANSVSHIDIDCQGLVTLHSLSSGQDSGYGPSPSFHSFSSDENEPTDSPEKPRPGVTPPITIPYSCLRPPLRRQTSHRSRQEASREAVQCSTSIKRGRSKSCPAASRPSVLPRLQVPHRLTVTPLPVHESTFSMPVINADGQQLLLPSLKTTNRTTPDAKDLMEEGGECVLLAALLVFLV